MTLSCFLLKIEAEDPDSNGNGEVSYSFSAGAAARISEMFSLDPNTGLITVRKSLRESRKSNELRHVISNNVAF